MFKLKICKLHKIINSGFQGSRCWFSQTMLLHKINILISLNCQYGPAQHKVNICNIKPN